MARPIRTAEQNRTFWLHLADCYERQAGQRLARTDFEGYARWLNKAAEARTKAATYA